MLSISTLGTLYTRVGKGGNGTVQGRYTENSVEGSEVEEVPITILYRIRDPQETDQGNTYFFRSVFSSIFFFII